MFEYLLTIAAATFDDRYDPLWSTWGQALPREPISSVGEYQEQSAEDYLSGILPEQYQRNEGHVHFMAPTTHVPRHVPCGLSRNAPWSTYSLSDDQIRRRPHSDEVLFAPEQMNISGLPHAERISQPTKMKTKKQKDTSKACSNSHGAGEYCLDIVGKPSPSNPVGPPSSASKSSRITDTLPPGGMIEAQRKGGRHGGLAPQSREDAWKTRKIGSCWNCVFVRGKV